MSDKIFPKIGVGVIVRKGGKFLMGKRLGKHGQGTWSVPGGHLEFGESWQECSAREVMEETGLKIKNVRLMAVTNNIFENENAHSITLWMESDWAGGEPKLLEPDKFGEHGWYTFQTLPSPLFEPPWQELHKARPDLFAG
jgi:8-oxo-dGTP diphosphatase